MLPLVAQLKPQMSTKEPSSVTTCSKERRLRRVRGRMLSLPLWLVPEICPIGLANGVAPASGVCLTERNLTI